MTTAKKGQARGIPHHLPSSATAFYRIEEKKLVDGFD
jgi:hypothetical protein